MQPLETLTTATDSVIIHWNCTINLHFKSSTLKSRCCLLLPIFLITEIITNNLNNLPVACPGLASDYIPPYMQNQTDGIFVIRWTWIFF